MTDQELKKLRRQDLLELLLAQSQEVETLKKALSQAEEKLQDRQILLEEAGSIAEAALQLNDVFEAAQAAAAQYIENIQNMASRQDALCAQREEDSRQLADERLAKTEQLCQKMIEDTHIRCKQMIVDAEREVNVRWFMLSEKCGETGHGPDRPAAEALAPLLTGPQQEGGQPL